MVQHTSGPWMLHDTEYATVVTRAKPGQFVALCDGKHLSPYVAGANARLIRAAPDLLEAAKRLDDLTRGQPTSDAAEAEAWAALRNAIQRAESS